MDPSATNAAGLSPNASCSARARSRVASALSYSPSARWAPPMLPSILAAAALSPSASCSTRTRSHVASALV